MLRGSPRLASAVGWFSAETIESGAIQTNWGTGRRGVAAFLLTSSGMTGPEMGIILADAVPRMTRLAQKRTRPFVATISRSGAITFKRGGVRRGGVRRDRR
jgi:hypothetical protein